MGIDEIPLLRLVSLSISSMISCLTDNYIPNQEQNHVREKISRSLNRSKDTHTPSSHTKTHTPSSHTKTQTHTHTHTHTNTYTQLIIKHKHPPNPEFEISYIKNC